MKKTYVVITLFFVLYLLNIFYDYNEKEELKLDTYKYNQVPKIDFNISINRQSYIFSDEAWNITRKKENMVDKNDINDSTIKPLVFDKTKYPITICDAKDCYEFIGIKGTNAVFYGKEDDGNAFIYVEKNDSLNSRITVKKIDNKKVELFDFDLNQTFEIRMFDLNVSEYKPKNKKDENNEN